MRASDVKKKDFCGQFAELLTDYLDRSLPARVEKELARHAEECTACASLLARTRDVLVFMSEAGRVEAPPELGWAVKRAIHRAARQEAERTWIRPLPMAVSAVAVALLMITVGLPGGDTSRIPVTPAVMGDLPATVPVGSTQFERYVSPASVAYRLPPDAGRTASSIMAAGPDSVRSAEPTRLVGARPVKLPF